LGINEGPGWAATPDSPIRKYSTFHIGAGHSDWVSRILVHGTHFLLGNHLSIEVHHIMVLARYIIVDELEKKTAELTDALDLLTQSYDDTLEALGSALELKDAETQAHCQRVTAYTIPIAKNVPVRLPYLTVLARAAFLHDIGKMAIPDIQPPWLAENLDSEKQIMRTHCEIGYKRAGGRLDFLERLGCSLKTTIGLGPMNEAISGACCKQMHAPCQGQSSEAMKLG
jgi:hypothetical protein